jgi:hypothetical protein
MAARGAQLARAPLRARGEEAPLRSGNIAAHRGHRNFQRAVLLGEGRSGGRRLACVRRGGHGGGVAA